jgi:hypothetical protein
MDESDAAIDSDCHWHDVVDKGLRGLLAIVEEFSGLGFGAWKRVLVRPATFMSPPIVLVLGKYRSA